MDILGFGKALTYPKQRIDPVTKKPMTDAQGNPLLESGFQPYQGELVAGETPLQSQAYNDLSRMQVSPQTSQATGFTGLAALQAQNLARYNPLGQQQYYQSPFEQQRPQSQPQTGGGYMRGPETTYGQTISPVGGEIAEETPRDFGASQYGQTISPMSQAGGYQNPLAQYLSPYMQGVVEQQKQQAVRDYSRQIPGLQAAGIRAGARGGTREALLQAEGQRGLNEQLQNIQATGLQNAYQQAAQQAMTEAATRAQYGLAGTQLGEQSRQFGAGLGLQGAGALGECDAAPLQLCSTVDRKYDGGAAVPRHGTDPPSRRWRCADPDVDRGVRAAADRARRALFRQAVRH
jgi:hypothetical protein